MTEPIPGAEEPEAAPGQQEPAIVTPLPPIVTEEQILGKVWGRSQKPAFKVLDTALLFFGMSASWLRLKIGGDQKDHPSGWLFHPDGTRMEFRRLDEGESARVFLLSDIQPMAESLYREGAISELRLMEILDVVRAVARLFGLSQASSPGGES